MKKKKASLEKIAEVAEATGRVKCKNDFLDKLGFLMRVDDDLNFYTIEKVLKIIKEL